jgi:hypothetical protein
VPFNPTVATETVSAALAFAKSALHVAKGRNASELTKLLANDARMTIRR